MIYSLGNAGQVPALRPVIRPWTDRLSGCRNHSVHPQAREKYLGRARAMATPELRLGVPLQRSGRLASAFRLRGAMASDRSRPDTAAHTTRSPPRPQRMGVLSPKEVRGRPDRGAVLLGERARLLGLPRQGRVSANGACRLYEARGGWLALNLPREADHEMLPALLGEAGVTIAGLAARLARLAITGEDAIAVCTPPRRVEISISA